jgi:DNA-directed RNA polymerase subunit K/omega
MSDIKTKVQGLDPNIKARDMVDLAAKASNVYEAIAVISKRSKQLSVELKRELHQKLEEFATSSDTIEEISENKEQIEISKFYERLPDSTLIATEEFLEDELHWRYPESKNNGI